ncbi:hydrogenase expression/formation protein HypE [Gehongia tenuis]|uniref:Hydrogenase expression/formation protein HypE n=1 Tax=Gehongia tenuis TaxID=2763655 RepID=A0A926D6X6_9FIRM|nr:hydrogenase expression/formation protein HypE [Gehongia tenuis]MBC8531480.1 hydrogenase expression/formation protein HypE [Gehongia tenuis]
MKITLAHGSGGETTRALIDQLFVRQFTNPALDSLGDCARVQGFKRLAVTTDSFVVTPLFFPGGDIGKLSVCGTVNDLAMGLAAPRYLTCGFILEEGLELDALERVAASMAKTARKAGVVVVAGDTKVVEGRGGLYINTAGVGEILADFCPMAPGDAILLSGTLGDHHAAILSSRLNVQNAIESDCAPLHVMVQRLVEGGIRVKALRDVTRGGLATILNELAGTHTLRIEDAALPVSPEVCGLSGLLGLDPLYMANEGKMVAIVDGRDADKALDLLRTSPYGERAVQIGRVTVRNEAPVVLQTALGGSRVLGVLYGEGLPRIC